MTDQAFQTDPTPYTVPTEEQILAQLQAARQEGATDNVLARLLAELHRRFDDVEAVSLGRFQTNNHAAELNSNRVAAVSQDLDMARNTLEEQLQGHDARLEALEAAPPSLRLSFENVRDLVSAAAGTSMPVVGG